MLPGWRWEGGEGFEEKEKRRRVEENRWGVWKKKGRLKKIGSRLEKVPVLFKESGWRRLGCTPTYIH